MYTKTELISRGWTSRSIELFLGEPDELRRNPKYKSAAPMRLYATARVEKIENSAKYKKHLEASKCRKIAAQKAVKTKREQLTEWAKNWRPTVHVEAKKLLDEAIESYNYGIIFRANSERASRSSSPLFLQRITMNYLRHECSDYEAALAEIKGRVGTSDAYEEIRGIIDQKLEPYVAAAMDGMLSYAEHLHGLDAMTAYRQRAC
jgi:hypothetical protein